MCHIILLLPIFALPLFWLLPLEEALIVYAGVCLLSAAFYWLLWRTMLRPLTNGIEGMIGGIGTVFGYGEGKTKILYNGEIWEAISKDRISPGEQVEIIAFDQMKLVVRRQAS